VWGAQIAENGCYNVPNMNIKEILEQLSEKIVFNSAIIQKLLFSVAIIFVLWAIQKITVGIIQKRFENVRDMYMWRKGVSYVLVGIGLILLAGLWIRGGQGMATFLGLFTAVLALVFKDVLVNIAGLFYILWENPFATGDRIEIDSMHGDVIDIGLLKFSLLEIGNWVDADQSTGRMLKVPNAKVFSQIISNYSKGFEFIWDEIPVLITFESDWRLFKKQLTKIINAHITSDMKKIERAFKLARRSHLIQYTNLTPRVYTTVKDSGVLLTIRHLCSPRDRRNNREAIWEKILTEVEAQPNVEMAYPTIRYYKEPGSQAS